METVSRPTKMWDFDGMKITHVAASPDDWYMALTSDGRLYGWGDSTDFKTGLGKEDKQFHPRLVEGFDSPVVRFSIGFSHGIAVSSEYGVFTWGTGKGLGNGGRHNNERTPRRVLGMEQLCVCDLSAGNNFSCVITRDGKIYSWGEGCSGKLGHGNEDSILAPTQINFFLKENIKIIQVACGGEFCLALSDTGDVYSWGSGSDGCLGVGNSFLDNLYEPTRIPYLQNICVISVVAVSAFAISKEGGLYAWGKPHLGLGSGRVMGRPIRVASLQKFRVQGIAAGEWQACVWVSSHDKDPPQAPSVLPWPAVVTKNTTVSSSATPEMERTVSQMGMKPDIVTAVDPEKFAAHENYLRKMPFMHRFFEKDTYIDNFAALGKLDEIREFLSQGKFWGPSPDQAKAIQHAVHATKQDEKVVKSWVVMAINSKDFEHERIFIVTDKAHYRIKYDPKKEEVLHAKRYPIKVVYQVMTGRFRDGNRSLSSKLRAPLYDKQFGFQIWTSNPKEWTPTKLINPFGKAKPPFYLYRPKGEGAEGTIAAQESVCMEICLALQASIHWYRNGLRPVDYIHEFVTEMPKTNDNFPAFPCRKVDFIDRCVAQSNGLLAYAHNKFNSKQ